MNGIPLEVNQTVMFRYRSSAFNDGDRKSLGSQKSILDLLFLIVITLGYRARPGWVRTGAGLVRAARQWVFGSMAGGFPAVYHRFKPSAAG
ncbi:hypothetical protein PQR36_26095 [Paraburkholderia nemoris]|uniref:hypothetical protein n=1 Tax=Paraburkholderia nemoris TaxID=2793076 RepID=UPI0038B6CAF1